MKLGFAALTLAALLGSSMAARAEQWTATRGAGVQAVAFDTNLPVYRTEYRWVPRQEYVCVLWNQLGQCLEWRWWTYYDREPYEVYDHDQASHISVQFPPDAALGQGQTEQVTLQYYHDAGSIFSRYDAFQIHVASSFHKYNEPTYRFDNWAMPDSYNFALSLSGEGQPNPPQPPAPPAPDPALAAQVSQNMTFALAAGSDGKGVLSVAVNPAFLAKKVVTQLDYEIDKFYKGSTMSFIVVKGQRAAADFANGGLAIPLYQELSSDNIYVLRLRLLNNLNKADYEWSQPITIGLAAPAAPAPGPSQALSTPQSLRIPKTPPAIAMPF